jgi:PAS domain S-box-containing protein
LSPEPLAPAPPTVPAARPPPSPLQNGTPRLQRLADDARDVIFRTRIEPPQVLEYVSPSVAALTGYSPEEFYRDPGLAVRIVHPDDRPIVSNLQNAGSEGLVIRWLHRSGRQLYVEPRVVLERDAQGVPCAVEGIVRDVTARVLAEEALRESSARLRSVFATMAEGVLFYDAGGRLVD